MAGQTNALDRIDRARSEPLSVTIATMDPIVVQVENDESGRVHTVVPESPHCSCEDHTYRNEVCKHMVAVLESDGNQASVVLEATLKEYEQKQQERLSALQERVNNTQGEIDRINTVLSKVDTDDTPDERDDEMNKMVNELIGN